MGSSAAKPFTVAIPAKPVQPAAISGPATVCQTEVRTYSIAAVAGATSYTWTAPAGLSIVSGQGSTSVQVSVAPGYASGTLKVAAVNCGGSSIVRGLAIKALAKPATPAAITGTTTPVCSSETVYSIAAIAGADSYIWTAPAGTSIVEGQGTTTIKLVAAPGFVKGQLLVRGVNCSGAGAPRGVYLYGSACTGSLVAESMPELQEVGLTVNAAPNPSVTRFTLSISGGNNGALTIRVYDAVGNVVEARSKVAPNTTLTIGDSYRAGLYLVEVIQGSERRVLKLVKQ
jgi:hypothetical protein